MKQSSHPTRNARPPGTSVATLFALLLACACGDGTVTSSTSGGASGAGAGGAAGKPSSSNPGGFAGAGGVLSVPSQGSNEFGDPVPRLEAQDVGVIQVACRDGVRATLVLVSDETGRCFDWTSNLVPTNGALTPDPPSGSVCAGYGSATAGVLVRFPDDAKPGETADGTLVVDTTAPAFTPARFDAHAELVETRFSLDPGRVDFGMVAVGQSTSATVTVTNLGTAPLSVLEPQAPVDAPFRYVDWAPRGEDQFVVPTVSPGATQTITVYFEPTASGDYSASVELTPFPAATPPECGAPQLLSLHGIAGQ